MNRLRRVASLLGVIARYFIIAPVLRRDGTPEVRLRKALESLGGAWVKLGQALALRFDILPESYCLELFGLLNKLEPFAYADVRRIIREELGEYPEDVFGDFEPEAFAAASIGQVHRATLRSGERVAVKIQRPGIRRLMQTDIRLMFNICWLIDLWGLLGATRARDLVEEFARWTRDELDYRVEAEHGYYLAQHAGADRFERNAHVFWKYTARRVLTTQLMEGMTVEKVIRIRREGHAAGLSELAAADIQPKLLARHICWNLLNQIYVHGYFHGDLHPANIIALPQGVVAYVDFGIAGVISPRLRDSLARYAWMLFRGEVDDAVREFMRLVTPSAASDVAAVRMELTEIFNRYVLAMRQPADSVPRARAAQVEIGTLDIVRRHDMKIRPDVSMYFKALITATSVIYQLDPEFDLLTLETEFFRRELRQRFARFANPTVAAEWLLDAWYRIDRLGRSFEQLLNTGTDLEDVAMEVRSRVQIYATLSVVVVGGWLALHTAPLAGTLATILQSLPWLPYVVGGGVILMVADTFRQSRRLPGSGSKVSARDILRRPPNG